jgi:hypothetical protein
MKHVLQTADLIDIGFVERSGKLHASATVELKPLDKHFCRVTISAATPVPGSNG